MEREKVHITLVGGQTAPVYYGINEFNPDRVILIYSAQTSSSADEIISNCNFHCEKLELDPTDLKDIYTKIDRLKSNYLCADLSINLTGGTKFWSLAFYQKFCDSEDVELCLIDQNNNLWNLRNQHSKKIEIRSLLEDSKTKISNYILLDDYTDKDEKMLQKLKKLRRHNFNDFKELTNDKKKPKLKSGSYIECTNDGDRDEVFIYLINKHGKVQKGRLSSEHILSLVFNSGWFEYEVALLLSKWKMARKIYMNVRFKTEHNADLNEVDIIVETTNNKLLFVECKTQIHRITDIDKFRSVVRNYGGLASSGVFITEAKVKDNAKEKLNTNHLLYLSMEELMNTIDGPLQFFQLDKLMGEINAK